MTANDLNNVLALTATAAAIRAIREITQLHHEQLTNDICQQLHVHGLPDDLLPDDDTTEVTAVREHLDRIAAHLEQTLRTHSGPDAFAAAEKGVTNRDDDSTEYPADLTAVAR